MVRGGAGKVVYRIRKVREHKKRTQMETTGLKTLRGSSNTQQKAHFKLENELTRAKTRKVLNDKGRLKGVVVRHRTFVPKWGQSCNDAGGVKGEHLTREVYKQKNCSGKRTGKKKKRQHYEPARDL